MSEEIPGGFVVRGLAYSVDLGVAFTFFVASQFLVFLPLREALGLEESWFHSGWNTQLYVWSTISLPVLAYFALFEASRWRATPGKRILGLAVVTAPRGDRLGRGRSFARTLVKLVPWELAHVTNHFPEPMWYTADPGFRVGFAVSGTLMGLYMLMVARGVEHRGPHDRLAGTRVVRSQASLSPRDLR